MRQLLRRAWHILRQRKLDAELAEEMEFHRAMKAQELEARGVDRNEAHFAARRAFGSAALAGDQSRDVWIPRALHGLGQDVRLAVRTLRATPVVTTVAVLSLALGIGANTAIFSLVNSLLLRVLPVRDPSRLVKVSTNASVGYLPQYSYATLEQIRRYGDFFDGAMGYTDCCGKSTIAVGGVNESIDRQYVSGDFFSTLGVRAFRGRLFTLADDEPGGADLVAVVSYRLWRQRFGGRDDIIGTQLTIDRTPLTVVGVTPPEFFGMEVGRAFEIAVPTHLAARLSRTPLDDDTAWLNVMFRLKPGISVAEGTMALRAVQPQIRAGAMPKERPTDGFLRAPFTLEAAGAGTSALRQRFERPLIVIFAVVALVLLIACANIGNLLLARGIARRHEFSVRVALGASRWRLARQLLVESIVLSASGAAVGLAMASLGARALVAQLSTSRAPILLDVTLDWRVLAFTAATTATTAILFGIAPALRATHLAPSDALKEQARGSAGDGRATLSNSLIVAQVVLSLLLVVAAGLFVQTFERLARVPLGLDRDRVLVVTVNASAVPAADRSSFFHLLVRKVATVPGVAVAGASMNPPIVGSLVGDFVVSAPGTTPPPDADRVSRLDAITPGWLAAYGTAIHAGRDIDDRDTLATPLVMVVNDAFVRRLFPGRNAVGVTVLITFRGLDGDFPWETRTIVGVVGDSVYRSIREPARPLIYLPMAQRHDPILQTTCYIGVRSAGGSPELLERSVAAALRTVNRDLLLTFEPLAVQVDESLAEDRLMAMLSGFFGVLALLLAGLGLYGVTAYAVSRRRREIGIRMALGAAPAGVVRLVMSRVTMLVGLGVVIGAGVSLWAVRFVASFLYGLDPRDPATLLGAVIVLAAVGALAVWLPARRASRIDPAVVLRYE